mmetsp:Transcript_6784/g.15739  ORF Transcript_6784/g.15739 Transcript_6784/m.15739 type:complete len:232 (-) Transcript_6784:423-1118(-)
MAGEACRSLGEPGEQNIGAAGAEHERQKGTLEAPQSDRGEVEDGERARRGRPLRLAPLVRGEPQQDGPEDERGDVDAQEDLEALDEGAVDGRPERVVVHRRVVAHARAHLEHPSERVQVGRGEQQIEQALYGRVRRSEGLDCHRADNHHGAADGHVLDRRVRKELGARRVLGATRNRFELLDEEFGRVRVAEEALLPARRRVRGLRRLSRARSVRATGDRLLRLHLGHLAV